MKVDEHLIAQLVERLQQAVHDTRHIEAAQVQIVALDAVRHRAGPLWEELAPRVRESTQEFIAHRIGPHDVVLPVGDGFVVVYAEPEDAVRKGQDLQDALDAFYLGEDAPHGLPES